MSTNESAPKRDRLLVKLDDLQNYNNADHAKRDAFRREFAKRAFGPSERVGDDGTQLTDDQLAGKLDAKLKPSADMTIEQQQALYDSASNRFSADREAVARQQRHNEAVARHTADTPPAAPESNPADATVAPAPELDANGHAGFTDTNDTTRVTTVGRVNNGIIRGRGMLGKMTNYFANGSEKTQSKILELRRDREEGETDEQWNDRTDKANKMERNGKIRRAFGGIALAAAAVGGVLAAKYGFNVAFGGNHEQAQDAATGSGSGAGESHDGQPSTGAGDHADQLRINEAQEFFNTGLDTTKLPGKNHINDFGTPSGHGFEGNKEGMMSDWSTLLRGNSRTMSTYLSEFDMGGVRGKPSAAELSDPAILAQYHQDLENHAKWLDANPVEHKRIYDELMATLGSAKIGELETYPGSYGSWYVNHETGEAMWDSVVNYDNVQYRTITLADGREYNINPDCFLQISEANAVVAPQGGGYQTPQGGGYQTPQGGGGNHYYAPTPEKPVYPEGDGNPPTENPPTENPPTENPPTENPPTGGEEPDKNPALSHRNDGGYTGNAGDLFSVDPNDFSNVDPTPTDAVRVDPAPVINNLLDGLNNGGSGGNFNTSTGDGKAVTPGTTSGDLLSGGGVGTADPSPNTSGGSSDTPRNSSGAVGE